MIGRWSKPPVEELEHPRGFDDFELKLGDIMRGERATIGKSLLDVQRELKIKATYIAAIENADPSVFETQGFIAGYVRSYARYLDLDPDWAFSRFCQESGFAVVHGMSPQASSKRKGPTKTAQKTRCPILSPIPMRPLCRVGKAFSPESNRVRWVLLRCCSRFWA
jgi:Uncharacterized protein conserved in bacteria